MTRCPSCNGELPRTGTQCLTCGADVGWHIRKEDGATYGPFDLDTIDRCLAEARLLPGDMVRIGPMGLFRPAHELLGNRFAAPPPPATVTYSPAATGVSPETRQWLVKGCAIAGGVLVLLVLIAVLASIPMMRRARARATAASCRSNLQQINMALLMYCTDYDDRHPLQGDWEQPLDPYVHNRQMWVCPTYPNEPGYGHNDKLAEVGRQDVRQPGQTLTFWDAGAHVQGFSPPPGTTSPRHSGSDHFGFVDGHVTSARPSHLQAKTAPR